MELIVDTGLEEHYFSINNHWTFIEYFQYFLAALTSYSGRICVAGSYTLPSFFFI